MVTLLIASFVLLALVSYAIYRWQRPSHIENADRVLPQPHFTGLFGGDLTAKDSLLPEPAAETNNLSTEERTALLARAASGDKTALQDTHASKDCALYDEVLNALVERAAGSLKPLRAIVSFIARSTDLRVNVKLCAAFIDAWRKSPDKLSSAEMLHTAALSDDAAIYQSAVAAAHRCWRDQKLQNMTAEELRLLVESEYWVLSSRARSSGAGFVLKQSIAALRRKLNAATAATRTR